MRNVFIILLLAIGIASNAQLRLAPVFTDNMVIQQNTTVPLWGWADKGAKIVMEASWMEGKTISTTANDKGEWRIDIKTPCADHKKHTVRVNDKVLSNVLLGEVWLCSGQSNMQWEPKAGIENQEQEIAQANYPDIRLFYIPRKSAQTPQTDLDASWKECTPETMSSTSAVGYFFARKLLSELNNVPIGLVISAWGGANVETFTPRELIESDPILSANKVEEPHPYRPHEVSLIYNQMIHPIVPFKMAGVLWYQGEANVAKPDVYERLLTTMIYGWRTAFQTELPFYIVQIAPYNYSKENKTDNQAARLREAQMEVSRNVKHSALVVVSDLVPDTEDIHPQRKKDVGVRLANVALGELYGKKMTDYLSPTFRSMKVKGNVAVISFNNLKNGLVVNGEQIHGLRLSDSHGVFRPAKGSVRGNNLLVWADGVNTPSQVQYCFDDATCGNISTTTGLPVAPFRTSKNTKQ